MTTTAYEPLHGEEPGRRATYRGEAGRAIAYRSQAERMGSSILAQDTPSRTKELQCPWWLSYGFNLGFALAGLGMGIAAISVGVCAQWWFVACAGLAVCLASLLHFPSR